MKSLIITRLFLFALFLVSSLTVLSQETLTANQWQEDITFLQNEINSNYSGLFKKIDQSTWNAEVEKLHRQIPDLEAHEVKVGISRIVSLFKYGHTQVPFSTLAKGAVLPINLYHFKDGVYVEGAHKAHSKIIGAKVVKIENIAIDQALEAIKPVVPVENEQYFKAYGLRFLTVPSVLHAQGITTKKQQSITITVEKEGNTFDYTLETIALDKMSRDYNLTTPNDTWQSARSKDETPLYLKLLQEKFYFFEYLEDTNVLYVRQSSVFDDKEETLAAFYERLFEFIDTHNISRLIYDVRLNGGGNNFNNLSLIKGLMARPQINTNGNFYYIIGRQTFSAAQNLTNEIERYTEAIIVGEPTAENPNFYGDAHRVRLPNSSIDTYISFAWWQDKTPWSSEEYTSPHIVTEMTFNDFVTNQDPVLEKALHFDATNFIKDPLERLKELFINQDFAKLEEESKTMIADERYAHIDFKDNLEKSTYLLSMQGNAAGATYLKELMTRLYPTDGMAWNNLADQMIINKNFKKAKTYLEKAITVDKGGSEGEKAKKKLKELDL